MTAPTMEQMLDELIARFTAYPLGAGSLAKAEEARNALLARFAELERERDEARKQAEQFKEKAWRYDELCK